MPGARKIRMAGVARNSVKLVQFTLLTLACFWLFACQAHAASPTPGGQSALVSLGVGVALLALAALVHFWRARRTRKRGGHDGR